MVIFVLLRVSANRGRGRGRGRGHGRGRMRNDGRACARYAPLPPPPLRARDDLVAATQVARLKLVKYNSMSSFSTKNYEIWLKNAEMDSRNVKPRRAVHRVSLLCNLDAVAQWRRDVNSGQILQEGTSGVLSERAVGARLLDDQVAATWKQTARSVGVSGDSTGRVHGGIGHWREQITTRFRGI